MSLVGNKRRRFKLASNVDDDALARGQDLDSAESVNEDGTPPESEQAAFEDGGAPTTPILKELPKSLVKLISKTVDLTANWTQDKKEGIIAFWIGVAVLLDQHIDINNSYPGVQRRRVWGTESAANTCSATVSGRHGRDECIVSRMSPLSTRRAQFIATEHGCHQSGAAGAHHSVGGSGHVSERHDTGSAHLCDVRHTGATHAIQSSGLWEWRGGIPRGGG